MTPLDTGTDATTPIHSPKGWQSAGSTQGTPGHLSIHFFPPWATFVLTRFGAPHHVARVQGPWGSPLVPHGGLPCKNRALQSSPMACHSRSGRMEFVQRPVSAGCPPSKTPPDSNSLMSVYVCISRYMHVYACICMYFHVYVCICMYKSPAQVNVCICMYMHVYVCI